MTTITKNDVMGLINSKGLDLNDPLAYLQVALVAEGLLLLNAPFNTPVAIGRLDTIDSELSLQFGEDKTLGFVLKHTRAELSNMLTSRTMSRLDGIVDRYSLSYSDGCCYCGSSKCVAHTRGESICGYDHSLDR